jgi:hypothetical protein
MYPYKGALISRGHGVGKFRFYLHRGRGAQFGFRRTAGACKLRHKYFFLIYTPPEKKNR